ncbi:hemin-degrading factor [Pseudooceanicola onchidii]|uniref:hemin-degrading factor n=1 Tax=Pseudooceanicola onchidii TaxID=2562279 RepID=UPI0010A9CC7F|nr:ChuX/HutX family heme-like substrate-binding protein [Pseudooceanicola onchidii]
MSHSPQDLRAAKADATLRDRDLAASLGVSEAALVAAHVGQTGAFRATRIKHHPDDVMPAVSDLGEVMSLTRNNSVVHERVGTFGEYRSGPHAAMVLGSEIDTRIFPKHWAYGFAVEADGDHGTRRSLQFFDTTGEALQKIYLRDTSNAEAWVPLVDRLRLDDPSDAITPDPAIPTEVARAPADKRDQLVTEWQKMTDTHQFNRICARLGMNRLGAYRLAGAPFVRRVDPACVEGWMEAIRDTGQKVVLFVGNRGHIQIHWGTFETVKPMGPWLNVLDPRFNLHLRGDHIAEAYVVDKPTKRGPAISLECFDAEGGLIFQCYGQREGEDDTLDRWHGILDALPRVQEAAE